jgi:hypothetical protein
VQLFMSIYQRFEEPDFQSAYRELMSLQWKDYDDYVAKYGSEANPGAYTKSSMVQSSLRVWGFL